MRQTLVAATTVFALALGALTAPSVGQAQGSPFAPRVLIDGKAITNYEYDQRLRFMTLLNAPGDLVKEAEKTLIDDRLRLIAAERLKIRLTPQQIEAGMAEFAGRFEMEVPRFVEILQANGVAPETFRDFVRAGLAWREVIRTKFGPGAVDAVLEPEIDRALSILTQKNTTRVLVSEILLPASKRVLADDLSKTLRGEAAFAAAARTHSLGPSAQDGGRVDWRNAAALPQQVVAALEGLAPGQVTPPVRLPDGRYAVYLLRQVELREGVTPQTTGVDHARLVIGGAGTPAGDAVLAQVQAKADSCNDLNAFPGQMTRETVAQSALPRDLAAVLAPLDDNEMVTYVSGGSHLVVMLCSRRVLGEGEPHRDTIRTRVAEARVVGRADLYLEQLRSNAWIQRP
ncbi:MAG: peptidylprolyl isomerase [Gemmobacter sp.]|nr:peptidylprolyl isomerase [Gemmobacter sp.]